VMKLKVAFVLVDAGTRDPGCQGVSTR
jgi:hypothetical protein